MLTRTPSTCAIAYKLPLSLQSITRIQMIRQSWDCKGVDSFNNYSTNMLTYFPLLFFQFFVECYRIYMSLQESKLLIQVI